ncbi:CAMK kinase [Fusarium beomiforme]|uniref:CAMK kinase n=1 Tax=Fusarium beomiforme TaxID=44412 RepID=A0A9P5AF21_9HYPO|nr:CAMK kinase [Fusarium beomiforme]
MDETLSDLVRDYKLVTRHEGVFTIHFHSDPDAPPSSPCRQERWRRVRTLGRGGQGEVILQTCIEGGRYFTERAVKRIRLQNGNSKQHYKRELESIVKFSHDRYSKYFVKSLGWYATSNKLYMAMEYFPEGDLYSYISNHQIVTEEECSLITSQILSGIALMHEEGFAHRDVKPQNILIYRHPQSPPPSSWWVKLADFGISKKLDTETCWTSLVPGTPLYMAPEILRCEPRSLFINDYKTADIWAVEISTLASQTTSQRWAAELHDATMLPKSLDPVPNSSDITTTDDQIDTVFIRTESSSESMEMLLPRTDRSGISQMVQELFNAIDSVDAGMVGLLVNSGVNINIPDRTGRTPLYLSATIGHLEITRKLLEGGAIIEATDGFGGRTPLQSAVLNGHIDVVELLITYGADIEVIDGLGGFTPLGCAVSMNYKAVTELLLNRKANVEAATDSGCTPLMAAARNGSEDLIILLLEHGADINATDERGHTPIVWAAESGSAEAVQVLIQRGVDFNAGDSSGLSALRAAQRMDHVVVKQLLLEAGADISTSTDNKVVDGSLIEATKHGRTSLLVSLLKLKGADVEERDACGCTPLILAASEGCVNIVEVLLDNGANIEASNLAAYTPLMSAADNGHPSVVSILLERRADVRSHDHEGRTSLALAARKGHTSTVQFLLSRNAPVHWPNYAGETALMVAAQFGHTQVVESLLTYGASIEASDNEGCTSLILAARQGYVYTVRLLLEGEAKMDRRTIGGQSALIEASKEGHEAVVELLLEEGAAFETMDIHGETALVHAVKRNHEAVVTLLLQIGADLEAEAEDGPTCLMIATRNRNKPIMDLLVRHGAKKGWPYYRARFA